MALEPTNSFWGQLGKGIMLTRENLAVLMGGLESEVVERTRAFDKMDKVGRAISAFANDLPGRGVPGYLPLGVGNDGRLSGKRVSDEQMTSPGGLKIEGALLPSPSISIEKFSFEDGDVEVIEVFPSVYPPIRFKGQARVRVGARKALAADEDLHILEERRQLAAKRIEILPCEGARLQDFGCGFVPQSVSAPGDSGGNYRKRPARGEDRTSRLQKDGRLVPQILNRFGRIPWFTRRTFPIHDRQKRPVAGGILHQARLTAVL